MGTICVSVVAAQDFYTIDRLLASPDNETFARMVEEIGPGDSRSLLRYLASELNRLFFQLWNFAQFGIGAAVLWLVLGVPQASKLKWPLIGMLAVVAFLDDLGNSSDPGGRPQSRLRSTRSGTSKPGNVWDAARHLCHSGGAQVWRRRPGGRRDLSPTASSCMRYAVMRPRQTHPLGRS